MKYLFLLLLAGCAAQSYVIKNKELLPYKESSQITKLNQESKTLTVASVEDHRGMKDNGFAYTGVEYKKTPVFMEAGMENMLKTQLSSALEVRNISVVPTGELNLVVTVKELNISELIEQHKPERAQCKLTVDFAINEGQSRWNGSFATSFISAGDLSDGTERLAPTLASCINELVEKLVRDDKFIKMLKKE